MPKFLFAYHGGHLPDGAEAVVGPQWKAWMDGLGAQGLDRGGPLNPTRTLGAGGVVTETDLAREVTGSEKADWWAKAVEVWPDYDAYQARTDREIPLLVLEPAS